MKLSNPSLTSDALGRYYTNRQVSSLLVDSLVVDSPELIIDLGAGSGALTEAAATKWRQAMFITVDIDRNAQSVQFPALYGSSFVHHVGDVLSSRLHERLGVTPASADVALCNPPYIRPKWRKTFASMLEEAGLSGALPKISDVPADILFIAQNLRFLKDGGRLGLIVPDGIIAGEKFAKVRTILATKHQIESVIELPRRIFERTEAKAHIVVVSKNGRGSNEIGIRRLDESGVLSDTKMVPRDFAGHRLDYSYIANQSAGSGFTGTPLRELVSFIKRGNVSSAQRKLCSFPVLHTSDITAEMRRVPSEFQYEHDERELPHLTTAQSGDILVGRVGRNFEEKVLMVARGRVVISDCIFVLRISEKYRAAVFRFLRSAAGSAVLAKVSRGVGARFLTQEALLNIKVEL